MVERARDGVAVSHAYRVLTSPRRVPGARTSANARCRSASTECGTKDGPGARGAGQWSPVVAAERAPASGGPSRRPGSTRARSGRSGAERSLTRATGDRRINPPRAPTPLPDAGAPE
eukprot:15471835-Alexandrium_andersonii.AAC.1